MNEQGRDALVSIPLEVPKRRLLDRLFGIFMLRNTRQRSIQRFTKNNQLRVLISTSLCKKAILVIALLLVPGGVLFSSLNSRTAYAAPSNYLNFQARLLTNVGNLVPDGTYNIEFKLYKSLASGASAQGVCVGGVTDDCEWLETRTGANKVSVTNGYFSVNLGSVTAFGGSIDWSQQQFLTMNIGGTGSPSWDGEMTPRIQLTSVPLAFVANNVASGGTSTSSTNSGNISIQTGNATGTTSNSGSVTIDSGTATGTKGTISLAATNASSLILGRSGLTTLNNGALTVAQNLVVDTSTLVVDAASNFVGILTASPANPLSVNALTTSDSLAQVAISTGATTNKGLVIQGVASQTAKPLDIQSSNGTSIFGVAYNASTLDATLNLGSNTGTISAGYDLVLTSGIKSIHINPGSTSSNGTYLEGYTRVYGGSLTFDGSVLQSFGAGSVALPIKGAASQTGDLLQLQDSSSNVNAAFNSTGAQLTLGRIASSGTVTQGKILFGDGTTDNFSATLQAATQTANTIFQLPAASAGTYGICTTATLCSGYASSTSAFVQGGNSFGVTALLGTSDNHDLEIGTNSNTALTIDTSQNATFAGNLAVTGTTSLYGQTNISFNTAASGDWGLDSGVTVFDPITSIGDYYGGMGDALFASNGNALSTATATLTGLQGLASNIAAGETIPLARGVNGQVAVNGDGSTTITTGAALYASNAITAAGVITNNYGLYVQNQTAGTNDYGVYVAGADTYALFVDSGITRLDGDLTVGGDATFQGNLSVSAGKYISLAGGNTASRPGSPTEGMIYFDTTTKQLLTYANGKWQADRSTSTKIVAASTSSQAVKDSADYVATGSSDQTTINTALTAAAGGKVYLAEGTYYDSDRIQIPNNTTLAGAGRGTEIQFTNLSGASKNMIENTDTSTGTGVVVRDLMLNGRSDINTTGSDDGIYFAGMGGGTGGSARQGGQILNIWAEKFTEAGIYLNSSNSYNAIIGNTMVGGLYGIRITSGSYNNVTGNTVMGTTAYGGIFLHTATYNTVSGNTTQGNSSGIYLLGGSNNTITGNTSQGNSGDGIAIGPSTDNTITGNTTVGNGGNGIGLSSGSDNNSVTGNYSASNVYGVFLNSASKNAVSGNTLKSNTYGIRTETSSSDSVTGNAIQDSTTYGIWVRATTDSTFSSNNISNSSGASNNNGIYIEASSTTNSFTSNIITDSSCTSTCYAINIQSGSNYNYLADNNYRTTAGTDQATINDAGTGTKYASQLTPAQILQSGSSLVKANATSVLTGSIDPAASTTVPGVGTKFTTELQIGDRITVTGETRTVTAIASDTSLTVDTAFSNNANDTSPDRLPAALVVQNSSGVNKLVIDDSGLATFSNDVTIVGSNLKFDAVSSGNPMITFDTGGGNIVTLQGERAYGDRLNLVLSGGGVGYGLKVTGNTAIFSNTSTTAFEIQNAGGTPLLTADTSAYKLTVDGDVVISAGKSLKITGGNTASRPGTTACTAEGMAYYDTTTHQLLVCTSTGGKWQADRTEAIIVAASNSSQADKDAADYVADGNTGSAGDGDQVQINAALSAASGRKVVLLAGTYVADETILIPNNTTLAGVGRGTLIELADLDATENLIENSDTSTGTGVVIRDLRINGRNDLNTAGTQFGIQFVGMGSGSSSSARQGGQILNTTILNFRDYGIAIGSSSNNIISSNTVQGNVSTGIRVESSSSYNTITGNVANGNGVGILIYNSSTNNMVSGNTAQGNSATGIAVWGSSINNTVSGNNASGNSTDGISVTSDKTTISGNTTSGNTQYGINVSSSYNSVTSNTVTGSTYGIWITGTYNSITGNTVQGNSNSGIRLEWSNNVVSGNGVHDNGGATTNSGILLVNSSTDYNTITGNNITDSSCTTDCYAINILAGDKNYLSGNRFIGSAANAASISDSGTNTIYEGQQVNTTTSTNSDLSDFRFRGSADSATAFAVQNAAGTSVLNIDTSADKITVGTSDTTGTLLVLDTKTGSGDPSGVNGAMYYNSNAGKFRCYEASAWKDCDTGGAGSGVTSVGTIDTPTTSADGAHISGTTIYLQSATASVPGLVSTTTQTFAGNKTFSGTLEVDGGTILSAAATSLSITTGTTGVLSLDSGTTGAINIGTGANAKNITVGNTTGATALYLQGGASGSVGIGSVATSAIASTVNIANTTDGTSTQTVAIGSNAKTSNSLTLKSATTLTGNTTGTALTVNNSTSTGSILVLQDNGTDVLTVADGGSLLLKNSLDSTTAFVVQKAGSTDNVLTVDTSSNQVILRASSATTPLLVFQHSDGTVAAEIRTGGIAGDNLLFGKNAGASLTAGVGNVGFGLGALANVSTGDENVAVGAYSQQAGDASQNTSLGTYSLSDGLLSGGQNTAVGNAALQSNTTGDNNVAIGRVALGNNEDGALNTAVGNASLNGNISGSFNTALGYSAGLASTGNGNVFLGYQAGYSQTAGASNIIIGNSVNAANLTGNYQLNIGDLIQSSDYTSGSLSIGNGVTSATPLAATIQGTGGAGSNVAGANLTIAAGAGTGSANGGNLLFNIAEAGGSGSSLNSQTTVFSLSGSNGAALLQNAVDSLSGFQIQNAAGTALLNVDTTNGILEVTAMQESINQYNNPNGGIGQTQNLLTFSEQFDNAAWTKTNVTATADQEFGPDNYANSVFTTPKAADQLTSTSTNGTVVQSYTTAVNGSYTYSVWLKTASGTQAAQLQIDSTGATPTSGTAKNITVSSTWQRFFVTQSFTGTPSNIKPTLTIVNNAATINAYGGQLNQGTQMLVYSRTTATIQAQNQGVISNGGLFASSLNASDKPLTVQSAPSQSADLITVQDSNAASLFTVSSAGALTVAGAQTRDVTTSVVSGAGLSFILQPGTSTGASINGAATTIKGGDGSGTTAVVGGALTLQAGSATGGSGTRTGGGVTIDSGFGGSAGTNGGVVTIGGTNAASLALGRTGITTTNNGALTVTQLLTASAGATLSGASSTLTFSGVTTDITTGTNEDLTIAPNGSGDVIIGTSDTTGTLLVLDTKTGAGDPTGVNGGMYYNSDLGNFRCYHSSVWQDCDFSSLRSEWVLQEDFATTTVTAGTGADLGNIGDHNWTFVSIGTGGTIAKVNVGTDASNRDRFGVLQVNSPATVTTGTSLRLDNTSMSGVPSNLTVEFAIGSVNAAAAAGLQQVIRVGLLDSTTATAPTDGIYFQYSTTTAAGNWFRCTRNASSETCTDTGVARTTTANVYERFKFQTNSAGTAVEFFINETSVGTNSTNLPGSTTSYGPTINHSTVDATIRQWKIDYFQIKRNLTTLR